MSKYCSDCKNLNLAKKKVKGIYFCKKLDEYTNTCNHSCNDFILNYEMNSFEKQKLYDDGKKALIKHDDKPISLYLFLFIISIVTLIGLQIIGF